MNALQNGSPGPSLFARRMVVKAKQQNATATPQIRSESTEDHLERMQELVDLKGYARVSDMAASLGLSRSTVSNMVRRLAKRGFVNYEKYRGFTLTAEGRAVANHVKVRHRTLTELLQLLGVSAETVKQEVEVIEHHLRPETLRVFSKLVRFWQNHPEQLRAFLQDGKSK
jgi:Mn-dependent DtxR family transcriptional regulator